MKRKRCVLIENINQMLCQQSERVLGFYLKIMFLKLKNKIYLLHILFLEFVIKYNI